MSVRRIAAMAGVLLAVIAPAASASEHFTFDTIHHRRSAMARAPLVCGRTTAGLRWRVLAFDVGKRTALFAERARQRPDGTWEPDATFGIATFNDGKADFGAGKAYCHVKGDSLMLQANMLEADGYPLGTLAVTVGLAGVEEEMQVFSACAPTREQWRGSRKKKSGCGG